jgi:hypothetical protein
MTGHVTFSTSTKWWSTSLLLIFSLATAYAQVKQTLRYEIPLQSFDKNFEIISADTSGLYVYRKLYSVKDDQLHIIKLDTAFREKWAGYLAVNKNYLLMGKSSFQDKLYLLFRYYDFTRNDLLLFAINHQTGEYIRYIIKSFIPFTPSEFQLTKNAALIGGYYNKVPVVLHFSFSQQKSKVLPGLFNEAGELTQVRTHNDGSFDVLISALNFQRQRTIWIKNYDPEGKLLKNIAMRVDDNRHLIFGRSLKTGQNQQIVAGVYGTKGAEYSRGLFISAIDGAGNESTRYYNFGDLENFFKYMRAKREKRVKSRIERKKIKGKRIRFNYRFLVHELIPYKDQYILLGEAFFPKYKSLDQPSYGGGYTRASARVFDGYHYTHAVVMGFDAKGNLLWDNSFEINDVRTFTLEQFVKLEVQEDKIALLYLFDSEIRTKIIQGDKVLEGKSNDPIKTLNENEIIKKEYTDESKLDYWYNDHLFAYGVQEIVNPKFGNTAKRRVFYINKVTYPK